MPDTLLAALSGQQIVHSSSLATVATNCILIRTASARTSVIISLSEITRMERVYTSYPPLLAVSAGLLLMAAAAYYSKDGGSAQYPLAALGLFFILAYFVSRKASVLFRMGKDSVQTVNGSLREAAKLMGAVKSAQADSAGDTPQALAS